MVDGDIQVWLDPATTTRPGFIIPYVVSGQPRNVRYRLRAIQEGAGGRAIIGQTGVVTLSANEPAALSAFKIHRREGDLPCRIIHLTKIRFFPSLHLVFVAGYVPLSGLYRKVARSSVVD